MPKSEPIIGTLNIYKFLWRSFAYQWPDVLCSSELWTEPCWHCVVQLRLACSSHLNSIISNLAYDRTTVSWMSAVWHCASCTAWAPYPPDTARAVAAHRAYCFIFPWRWDHSAGCLHLVTLDRRWDASRLPIHVNDIY